MEDGLYIEVWKRAGRKDYGAHIVRILDGMRHIIGGPFGLPNMAAARREAKRYGAELVIE